MVVDLRLAKAEHDFEYQTYRRRTNDYGPWVGLGCGNGVGFVVKCVGIHVEASDST